MDTTKSTIMKNKYLFAVLLVIFFSGFNVLNAQFAIDDMESYGPGNPISNSDHWSGDLLISVAHAQSPVQSGLVDDGGTIDVLLLLGDKIFGSWGVKYSMYIPSGKIGYWNLQGLEDPGLEFVVGNIFMGNSGIGGDDEMTGRIDMNTSDETDDFVFTFPKDQWFDVTMNFDFNIPTGGFPPWTLWVDDVNVVPEGTPYVDGLGIPPSGLGAVNFFSISSDNEMYIDDVEYINDFYPDPSLGVNDLDSVGFTSYPNPVKNVLNLQANEEITSAVVYNILGQEVYNANINAINATIDMASFTSGAYFVKVNVGGTEGVIKVLK